MAWWGYVLVALGAYLLLAGGPWLVLVVVQRLLARQGPFLEAETQRRQRLRSALGQQRDRWPAVPRLGRFRELDQKALDRLNDLTTTIADLDALWPNLVSYVAPTLSVVDVALFKAWPAMLEALKIRRTQKQMQSLLANGEHTLEEIVLLDGLVADIPSAVIELARTRAQRVAEVLAAVRAEEVAGTQGLEGLRGQAATLQADVTALLQRLEVCPDAALSDDEALWHVDQELDRIGAVVEELNTQLEEIATQRATATNLLAEGHALLLSVQSAWARLTQQGANDPELAARIKAAEAQLGQVEEQLAARTPEAYAEAQTSGEATKGELSGLGQELEEFAGVIEAAIAGISGDVAAIEDARRAMAELEQRALPVLADASLTLIEQATASYHQAEERARVGTLAAYRESVDASMAGRKLLDEAMRQGAEAAELADRAETLLEALSDEHRQELSTALERLTAEMSVYATMWRNRFASRASEARQELHEAGQLVAQLPPTVTARERILQSELPAVVETLTNAQALLTSANQQLAELYQLRDALLAQRQELEAGVSALRERIAEAKALQPQMLPACSAALDQLVERLEAEGVTMITPAQADYDVALGSWLPSLTEELDGVFAQHAEDVKQLKRELKDRRSALDRSWRRLQAMLDRDPRRPAEDVDALYQTFEAWWDRAEAVDGQAAAMAELVEVQAPEIEERIQRAISQLEEGRQVNRDLTKDLARKRRDLDRARSEAVKRDSESGWPHLAWDRREADDLWRRVGETESASQTAPSIVQANQLLEQAIALADQALEAYARERAEAEDVLDRIEDSYQSVAKMYDAGVRHAAELRSQGPSPELTALEERLDAARRDLDAARAAASIDEAMQRLQLAQDLLRNV